DRGSWNQSLASRQPRSCGGFSALTEPLNRCLIFTFQASVPPLPPGDAMPDRPPITNPESAATRERLLDAAERLFAERGFRSASVRDITRESSCNIAAVNYHFGGKSNLYREVFLRRLRAVRKARLDGIDRALSRAGSQATLELLLQEFTGAFVSPYVDDPSGRLWMLLLAQEMIDPQLPPATFQAEM